VDFEGLAALKLQKQKFLLVVVAVSTAPRCAAAAFNSAVYSGVSLSCNAVHAQLLS
jgi:hypothetical protein